MNQDEFNSLRNLMSLPADLIAKEMGIEWLSQKSDGARCTSVSFQQLQACTRSELMQRVMEEISDRGFKGIWLVKVYPIWSIENDCGYIHIVIDGVFE